MSRRIAALVTLAVAGILFASACANNATGPAPVRADNTCDYSSQGTCRH